MSLMDTLYSEPFEYSTAQDVGSRQEEELYCDPNELHEEVDRNWRGRYSGAGRSTAIRRKSNPTAARHDDMGQSDSTPEYMEVFNDPTQPTLQNVRRLNSRGIRMSEGDDVMMRRGHQNEDSSEYCYTSSVVEHRDEVMMRRGHQNEDSSEYCYTSAVGVEHRYGPPLRSVSLKDDYSQPQDRLSAGIVRPDSQDYTEPYQSEGQGGGPPTGVPASEGAVYELAKDVSELHVQSPTQKPGGVNEHQYSHTTTSTVTTTTRRPEDGGDFYDHTETWLNNRVSGTSENTGQKQPSPVRENFRSDDALLTRGSQGDQKRRMQYADIPPSYEEPWDTGEGGRKLSLLLDKAEKRDSQRQMTKDSQRQSADQRPSPQSGLTSPSNNPNRHGYVNSHGQGYVNSAPVGHSDAQQDTNLYESAWETRSGIPNVMMTSGQSSVRASGQDIVRASGQTSVMDPEESFEYQTPKSPPVSMEPKRHISPNYEEAWDTPMKQAEFEHKLSQARKERVSKGQIAADELDRVRLESERSRAPEERCPIGPTSPTWQNRRSDKDFMRSESSRSMAAIAEKIDKHIPLEEQMFYHGTIKRYDAERKLLVFKEGSYIIRRSESNKRDYSLTLKGWDGTPMHMKIACKPDGKFVLGENSPPFTTIPEMVDYYTTHELPVQNADRICLLYPVPS